MNRLPPECIRLVLSHLGLRTLFSTKVVCKSFCAITESDDFAEEYLLHNFWYSTLSNLCLTTNHTHQILAQLGRQLIKNKGSHLLHNVVDVSSVDRALEGPRNVLSVSACYALINARPLLNPVHCQVRCNCAGPQPCYWSSSPSESEEKIEFITFVLKAPVSLLIGFYVAPYQAFFHPGAPIYGPKEIAIQILKPRNAPLTLLNEENLIDHYQHPPLDLTADVYYQSPFYPLENTRKNHFIYLPKMVLCVGPVRVLLKGMHTRQPGQQFMLESDDFYLCISRLDVVGIALDNFDKFFVSTERQSEELEVKPVVGPRMELGELVLPSPLPHHHRMHSSV